MYICYHERKKDLDGETEVWALYFHVKNNQYIITHGFTKKTPKTPVREIQHAKMIKVEYEEEQYANNKIWRFTKRAIKRSEI